MRDSVLIYRSFWEAIKTLKDKDRLLAITSIIEYGLNGTIPDISGAASGMFMMAKPIIDKNNKRYENGKNGGRPRNKPDFDEEKTREKPNQNQIETECESNICNIVPVHVNEPVNCLKDINSVSSSTSGDRPVYPYKDVIDYLNTKAGTKYRHSSKDTQRYIRARIDDGFALEDFYTVIDKKVAEWKGTEFEKFLRPGTLFGPKFESYLNQTDAPTNKKNRFHNFTESDTDYDALIMELNGVNEMRGGG